MVPDPPEQPRPDHPPDRRANAEGSADPADDPPRAAAATSPGRVSRGGLVVLVVGALVLVALVLVLLQREPARFPAGSPERTVQAWLQSVVDERPDASLLAGRDCEVPHGGRSDHDQLRVSVLDTTIDGGTARVDVQVTEHGRRGLFDAGYSHDETYRLRRIDGSWLITGFAWPWDACWSAPLDPED